MKASFWLVVMFGLLVVVWISEPAQAQGRIAAARATAEFLIEKFGGQAAREGVEALAARIEGLAARHGEEIFQAVRKCGPQCFKIIEEAGVTNAGRAVRFMAEYGEGGVAWVLKRPKALSLVARHGEEAAAVLVKHPGGICEPLIERCGEPAIKALQAVGPQGGRRLAMLIGDGGELAAAGRGAELCQVVGAWGEKGMEFVWKHKGALATTTVLAAFLAGPAPFITGLRDLSEIVAENAIRPIADIPGEVAREAAKGINWTLIVLAAMLLGAIALATASGFWRRVLARPPETVRSTANRPEGGAASTSSTKRKNLNPPQSVRSNPPGQHSRGREQGEKQCP